MEENLIIIVAEKDMIATTTTAIPYLEVKKDATECAFISFEISTTTSMKDESDNLTTYLSKKYLDGCKSTHKKRSQGWIRSGKELSRSESSNSCDSQE